MFLLVNKLVGICFSFGIIILVIGEFAVECFLDIELDTFLITWLFKWKADRSFYLSVAVWITCKST